MGIGTALQTLINYRNTNVNEVANITGVNPQTLYSIIKRDSMKANIDDLYKVAHHLGVTLDYFYSEYVRENNEIEILGSPGASKLNIGNVNFESNEQIHLNKYRQLNADGQAKADDYIDDLIHSGKYNAESKKSRQQEANSQKDVGKTEALPLKDFHTKLGTPYELIAYDPPGGHPNNDATIPQPGTPEFERQKELIRQYHKKHKPEVP